jgi:aspartate/methionine/tyrosine aminotransferase
VTSPINPAIAAADAPAIAEARRWIAGRAFPADRPLINLSQAAPVAAPPKLLRCAIADAALNRPEAHMYGPILGYPDLRAEIAGRWSAAYGGAIDASEVAITAGCNQAYCAAIATLAGPGDAVLLPYPWYFNHKMWLDMSGIEAIPLPCGDTCLPDLDVARALVGPRVKAIVLVTPNNPTGAEYPAGLLDTFYDLAAEHGAALVVDETYRDFHKAEGAPHGLFARPDWRERLVHLYSFSKVFRLTGHRIGAVICGADRMAEIEKFLDTVTICPAQLGQIAALEGLRKLSGWVAEERAEILARRAVVEEEFRQSLPGWTLMGCGAYFAYLRHPFDEPSPDLCKRLVAEQSLLILPGTMFCPAGDPLGPRTVRLAFANADASGLRETLRRLGDVR